jgi:hypothetical protein
MSNAINAVVVSNGGRNLEKWKARAKEKNSRKTKLAHLMYYSAITKPEEVDGWFYVPTDWLKAVQAKLLGVCKKNPGPMPLWKLLDSSGQLKPGLKRTSMWFDANKTRREDVAKNTVGWKTMSDEEKMRMIQTRQIYQVFVHAMVCIGPDGDYVSVTRELWDCLVKKYGTCIDSSFLSTTKPNIGCGLF